jgi:hypothetical protein
MVGPLHGDRGGPIVCVNCGLQIFAKLRAAREQRQKFIGGLGFGPASAADTELSLELLEEALRLTHPDRHPPERAASAHRVTAQLLALRPHVKPRAVATPTRDASVVVAPRDTREAVTPRETFPCAACRETLPLYYCDDCNEKWGERKKCERDALNAKARERRARRKLLEPSMRCITCAVEYRGRRRDSKYCSAACRQRQYRKAVSAAAVRT